MTKLKVSQLNKLKDPGSRGFTLDLVEGGQEAFVVKKNDKLYAYLNSCPHTGAPLDWVPHQFLNLEGNLIQCAVHGALFEIDTGLCVYGPCVNRRLEPLKLEIKNGKLACTTRHSE
ncbi:MAG: Rieske (2Fe-2S) protein [Gammaproteobacteria bacterium]|nr:Rieske (2Fe-2S) protein [Gammaproteobacteria bacterium]